MLIAITVLALIVLFAIGSGGGGSADRDSYPADGAAQTLGSSNKDVRSLAQAADRRNDMQVRDEHAAAAAFGAAAAAFEKLAVAARTSAGDLLASVTDSRRTYRSEYVHMLDKDREDDPSVLDAIPISV